MTIKLGNLKLRKTMWHGKYVKVNGKHIKSIGYFAYDGCHKIYVLESTMDVELAMNCGYRLLPIGEIRETYEKSCPLKFIDTMSGGIYVKQCEKAKWSEVKVPKRELDQYFNDI